MAAAVPHAHVLDPLLRKSIPRNCVEGLLNVDVVLGARLEEGDVVLRLAPRQRTLLRDLHSQKGETEEPGEGGG